jgi:hypothetical protein
MARALIADLCDTALFSEYLDPTAEDVVATSEEALPVRWRFFQPKVGQQPSKVCRSLLVCDLITHQKHNYWMTTNALARVGFIDNAVCLARSTRTAGTMPSSTPLRRWSLPATMWPRRRVAMSPLRALLS